MNMVVGYNGWVIDSRTIRYICGDREPFFYYTLVKEGEEFVSLGDSRSTLALGMGKVLLKLTFGKTSR